MRFGGFIFFFLIVKTQVRRDFVLKALVSGFKAFRALDPKQQRASSSLSVAVNTGLLLMGCTGQKRSVEWRTQDFPGLGGKVEFRLNFSQFRPSPSWQLMPSHREQPSITHICRNLPELIRTWSEGNLAWLVKTCCYMPLPASCLPNI